MAQLKDLLVSGPSRLIGKLFTNEVQLTTLNIPTTSGGTTYGPGTSGQALVSNGTSAYWKTITIADIGGSDVLPISKGGTGNTVATQGGIVYGNGTTYALTTAGSSGQVLQSAGTGTPTWITATNSNTASTIVKRDASGNFSAGTITATLSGNASSATKLGSSNVGSTSQPIYLEGGTPKAATAYSAAAVLSASKFTAAQSVTLTGDVTGTASSVAGWEIATTLATQSGVTGGSYGLSADASPAHGGKFKVPYVTVNTKGLVTGIAEKEITLPTDNNTDVNVSQTATSTSAEYEVLFSGTADNTTRTEGARKDDGLLYNPSSNRLTIKNGILRILAEDTKANDRAAQINFETYDTDQTGSRYTAYIRVYNDHDNNAYGSNMVIGSDSGMVIGAGESPSAMYSSVIKNSTAETLWVTSDGVINVEANANTIGNRLGFQVTTAGAIIPVKAEAANNNVQNIGASDNKWNTIYASTFDGTATNATTAAKLGTNAGSSTQPVYFTNGVPTAITGNIANGTTGNAATATKFASSQTIKLEGDVTGEASSQAGWTITTTLANSGVTATSYGPASNASPAHGGNFTVPYITVDAKGRITAASSKTITLPSDNNTDTLVTQTNTTGDASYRLLLSESANDTTETKTARKSTKLQFNPSSGRFTFGSGAHINQVVTGTNTAASDGGSSASPNRYKWTFNLGFDPITGDTIIIKTPGVGHDYGVYISTNNGTNYHPVCIWQNGSRLTTHYAAGTYLHLVYDANQNTTSVFNIAGSDARETVTGSWYVLNYYDSNSNWGYYTRRVYSLMKAGPNKVFPYTLMLQTLDGRYESTVTSSTTGTGKTKNAHGFRLDPLIWMYANATYNENNVIGTYNTYHYHSELMDARYTFNLENTSGKCFVANQPVYLVGTINATDGLFYLDDIWWTQSLPNSANGKIYIYLGDAYDWYRMTFINPNPIYYYNRGGIRIYSGYAETAGTSNAVYDYNDGTKITFGYSTAGMSSTSWLGSWDGYKLRAISPANVTAGKATAANLATSQYGIAYYSNTTGTFASTIAGTAGYVLKSGGGTAAPSWMAQSDITSGYASKLTALTTGDAASSTATERYVWISYNDNSTGRPAYTTALTFQTSTGTLKATKFSGDGSGLTNLTAANISAGTLPIARGGTNATSVNAYGVVYGNSGGTAYASTVAGTAGYILKSGGGSAAPSWIAQSDITAGKLGTNAGSTTIPVYFDGGIPKAITGAIPIANGGTGATTAEQARNNLGCGTAATYNIDDATSNGALGTGTGLTTERSVYYGLVKVNGASQTRATGIYAPTDAGIEGCILISLGSGAPGWTLQEYLDVGAASKLHLGTSSAKCYVCSTPDSTISDPTHQIVYNTNIYTQSNVLYGAAWNDYAEYRETEIEIEPGRVVVENGDDTLSLSTERMQPGAEIVSDTFGFAIGETEKSKTPIAASGRVLAYPHEPRRTYKPGQPVCSGPNGTVSQMTDEEARAYPWLIIGTVSAVPEYETWGEGKVKVNGRIWIRIR